MSYILDNKSNIGSTIIPIGISPILTVYGEFSVNPLGSNVSYLGIHANGNINIGDVNSNSHNNLILNAGIDFNFMQIIDTTITEYALTNNDYAIEIISDTINSVILPYALHTAGKTYIVSRGSNNNDLILKCQAGENIDTRQQLGLSRKHVHLKVMSNGQDSWYIV